MNKNVEIHIQDKRNKETLPLRDSPRLQNIQDMMGAFALIKDEGLRNTDLTPSQMFTRFQESTYHEELHVVKNDEGELIAAAKVRKEELSNRHGDINDRPVNHVVDDLVVAPDYRGEGVATELLSGIEDRALADKEAKEVVVIAPAGDRAHDSLTSRSYFGTVNPYRKNGDPEAYVKFLPKNRNKQ